MSKNLLEEYKKHWLANIVTIAIGTGTIVSICLYFLVIEDQRFKINDYRSVIDSQQQRISDLEGMISNHDAECNKKIKSACIAQTQETIERLNKKEDSIKVQEQILKDKEKQMKAKYSDAAKKYNTEQKVIALMDKFSALGVDLHHEDWCDKDYTKRFYEGEAILNQIYSIASSNNLDVSYTGFVHKHKAGFITAGDLRKCKQDDSPPP